MELTNLAPAAASYSTDHGAKGLAEPASFATRLRLTGQKQRETRPGIFEYRGQEPARPEHQTSDCHQQGKHAQNRRSARPVLPELSRTWMRV